MGKLISELNHLVWGIPSLILILGTGIYLSCMTHFIQIRMLPAAIKLFYRNLKGQNNSSYRSLCTALAATIGTGNLVGVAGAIAIGGPGSIFWMWICAIFGMATKFAESTLSVFYQVKNNRGELVGGPMYMIEQGLGKKWNWLSKIYCYMGIFAAFGVGNATQVNAITNSIHRSFDHLGTVYPNWGDWVIGAIVAAIILITVIKGIHKIGELSERLVPAASVAYLMLSILILIYQRNQIPQAIRAIIDGAFHPAAVTGGMIGSLLTVLRTGACRGVFTNEAGMGTASIAHGGAKVRHPVDQGLMGVMEVFIDTIVICTITALVILSSGIPIPYGTDTGVSITSDAFSASVGTWASVLMACILCCFAFATILGWGFYGARCAQYLLGEDVWSKFVWLQTGAILLGAVLKTDVVWVMAETVNGLMAVPNLIALLLLSPKLKNLVQSYRSLP